MAAANCGSAGRGKHINPKTTKWVYGYKHPKLETHDVLIDLADIHHASRKMYETGKISKRVLKKWYTRARKNTKYPEDCDHLWLPDTVFAHTYKWPTRCDGWRCLRCHTWMSHMVVEDLPISFRQEPYLSRCEPDLSSV